MAEAVDDVADARVAEAWVLRGDADDELGDLGLSLRSSLPASMAAAVVLPGDEESVPSQERLRRDDASHSAQRLQPKSSALHGQAAPLVIREAQSTATELLAQDAVLLLEVVDDVLLLPIDPAGEEEDEQLETW